MRNSMKLTICAGVAALALSFLLVRAAYTQQDPAANVGDGDAPAVRKKPKPADINGCWTGAIEDSVAGSGTISFRFKQNGAKIVKDNGHNSGSRVDVEYPMRGFFNAPLTGTITNVTSIKFSAVVNKTCSATGTATVINASDIAGELDYTAGCGMNFGHVTYQQLTPMTCS